MLVREVAIVLLMVAVAWLAGAPAFAAGNSRRAAAAERAIPPLPYPHPHRASASRKASTARAAEAHAREQREAGSALLTPQALRAAAASPALERPGDDRPAASLPPSRSNEATAGPAPSPPASGAAPPPSAAEASARSPADDTWSAAEIEAAARECDQLLQSIGAQVELLAPLRQGSCGAPAPLKVSRIGSGDGVALEPPAVLNCPMVARLYQWLETVAQPAAREALGARIVKLTNASAYMCRNRYNDPAAKISEHAFANAIDVSAFELSDRRRIDVKSFWGKDVAAAAAEAAAAEAAAARAAAEKTAATTAGPARSPSPAPTAAPGKEPPRAEADGAASRTPAGTARTPSPLGARAVTAGLALTPRVGTAKEAASARPQRKPSSPVEYGFLRRLHSAACGIFSTVLGPEANAAHHDHFHLDLKQRRHAAVCE